MKWLMPVIFSSSVCAGVTFTEPSSELVDASGETLLTGSYSDIVEFSNSDALMDGSYSVVTPTTPLVKETAPPPPPPPPSENANWSDVLIPYIPPVGEIRRIPNTSIESVLLQDDGTPACQYLQCRRSTIVMTVWTGMSLDRERGIARQVAAGGHADIGTNSVYTFDFNTLSWSRDFDYAQPVAPYPDLVDTDGDGVVECAELEQGPMGTHSYDGLAYLPNQRATLLMRTSGYRPLRPRCNRTNYDPRMVLWHDAGGYEFIDILAHQYTRSVYDSARDKVYMVSYGTRLEDPVKMYPGFYEIDPNTFEIRKIDYTYASSTGSMDMDGRTVYWAELNVGIKRRTVSLDGEFGPIERLTQPLPPELRDAGLAVSGHLAVLWGGNNTIGQYDANTGEFTVFQAGGETLTGGDARVLGKWWRVRDGVFAGFDGNGDMAIYRAY